MRMHLSLNLGISVFESSLCDRSGCMLLRVHSDCSSRAARVTVSLCKVAAFPWMQDPEKSPLKSVTYS